MRQGNSTPEDLVPPPRGQRFVCEDLPPSLLLFRCRKVRSYFISTFGRAFFRSAFPLRVTLVPRRSSTQSFLSPARCFSPASVTLVLSRFSLTSFLSPARCFSPASVTLVSPRFSSQSCLNPAR